MFSAFRDLAPAATTFLAAALTSSQSRANGCSTRHRPDDRSLALYYLSLLLISLQKKKVRKPKMRHAKSVFEPVTTPPWAYNSDSRNSCITTPLQRRYKYFYWLENACEKKKTQIQIGTRVALDVWHHRHRPRVSYIYIYIANYTVIYYNIYYIHLKPTINRVVYLHESTLSWPCSATRCLWDAIKMSGIVYDMIHSDHTSRCNN